MISSISMIPSFVKENPVSCSFVLGIGAGALGLHLVRKLYEEPASQAAFDIIDIAGELSRIERVSLSQFKPKITYRQLNMLRRSVRWGERSEEIWRRVFEKSSHIVCVIKDHQLVGFGCFVGNGRMGTIFDIHVHPQHQQQGIGTRIMNRLIMQIQKEKYTFVGLFGWEENASVLNFYRRFGFEQTQYGMESSSQKLKSLSSP